MAKSILCYGDSITWGYNPKDGSRLPPEDRWPRVLDDAPRGRARVVEEGLHARTVATDEPSRPCFKYLWRGSCFANGRPLRFDGEETDHGSSSRTWRRRDLHRLS